MTGHKHDYSKFQYFEEDCECAYCINKANKSETDGRGCKLLSCAYSDIREDARANRRIKREKGWNKHNTAEDAFKPDSYAYQ